MNDEYTKKLKGKSKDIAYLEKNHARLFFTNSCWEIQRVNPMRGGNLVLDEVYRLKHLGTGKFLAVSDDR